MRVPGFIGGSDEAISKNWNIEKTFNLMVEARAPNATPKTPMDLLPTPCLTPWIQLPDLELGGSYSPIRNLFAQDGRLFAIAGNVFIELFSDGTFEAHDGVGIDNAPGTIASNGTDGHQLFIVSAGQGYIFDLLTDSMVEISDSNFPLNNAAMGGFLDGYFFVLERDTDTFYISDLEDGLTWNGLDVGQSNFSSDVSRALVVHDRKVWLFGSQTSVPWFNSGAADFPLQPINGVFLEQGIVAIATAKSLDDHLYWLGGNHNGVGRLFRAREFQPEPISTPAIEDAWSTYLRIDDAIAWTYTEAGHSFYVLYFPSGDTTWVFDATTNHWHERPLFDTKTAQDVPDLPRCHAYAFGKHLVGDRQSATIYEQSRDELADDLVAGSD